MLARRGTSRSTSGPPPVSRTSCTPIRENSPVRRAISSKVRISSRSSQGRPSAGMQYWQRKLHRSVTETRRSPIGRPWPSWRGSRRIRERLAGGEQPKRDHVELNAFLAHERPQHRLALEAASLRDPLRRDVLRGCVQIETLDTE